MSDLVGNRFSHNEAQIILYRRLLEAEMIRMTLVSGRTFERTTCIKKGFWPPLKPKNEAYFSLPCLDCFTRLMPQVFIFHIDLSLSVAMVTENGRQYRLKCRKCNFGPHFGGFTDSVFKNKISVQLNTKKIF